MEVSFEEKNLEVIHDIMIQSEKKRVKKRRSKQEPKRRKEGTIQDYTI